MRRKSVVYALVALYAVVLTILSYWLQMYQYTALEEVHIMLYDPQHISAVFSRPGGLAQILASLCSQMFICRFAGPLIMGIVYALMISMLTHDKLPLWMSALAPLPCLCLMLCLENSSYMLQGTMAMLLCIIALWLYTIVLRHTAKLRHLYTFGIVLNIFTYWAAGSVTIVLALCCMIYTVVFARGHWLKSLGLSLAYPVAVCAVAFLYYRAGYIDTLAQAYTPAMYYDMGSTYYMYLYAMVAMVAYTVMAAWRTALTKSKKAKNKTRIAAGRLEGTQSPRIWPQVLMALGVFAIITILALHFYGMVHSRSNYENQQQRYYARHAMWDAILAMPYDGGQTPYTSYRFLALAQKGRLAAEVKRYRPFISYIFENKPKVKKRDQQVYSDIWYSCDYMPAARKAAFDTDIVTPGAFNPYETLKLAEINIVYGDYAVAEKLITWLEKTLFYKNQAKALREYLYDDSRVEADPVLGPKRRAIGPQNDYLSPKGIMRDLKHVVDQNSEQQIAQQFYDIFMILTNQQ